MRGGSMIHPWFDNIITARFWAKVNKDGPIMLSAPDGGPCWLWTASLRHKGYGAFAYTVNGRTVHDRAHRFSFLLHGGLLDDGLFVLHRCDNPRCVNPDHLFAGTNDDNIRDMMAKGRHVPGGTYVSKRDAKYERGEAHHAARLNCDIVRSIRLDHASGNYSYSQLARKHGLSLGHTHRIVTRKAWSHVE